VTLDSKTSAGLTSRSDSSQLSVLLVGLGNPVDSGVVSDAVVVGVNANDLVVFVGSVLSNPIAVQDSQAAESSTDSLFSLGAEVSGGLELVDTDGSRLSRDDTFGDGSFATSSSDSASVDDIAFFGLEAELSGLVGARGVVDSADDGQLSVLPGADSEDEVHQVALFLSPEFFKVLIGSHTTK